jgi:hypothetical protein
MRVLLAEDRKQGRKKVFSGDGTRSEEKFTGERGFVAGDFPASFPVEVENPLGVLVEFLTRSGKKNPATFPLEERFAEFLFESLNTLTDCCLTQVERLRRPGEVAQLSSLREGFEIGKLHIFGLSGVHEAPLRLSVHHPLHQTA